MTEVKELTSYQQYLYDRIKGSKDNIVKVDEDIDTIHITKEIFISEVNKLSEGKTYPIKMTSEQMDELWLKYVEHIVSYSSGWIKTEIS